MLKRAHELRVAIDIYVPTDENLVLCQLSSPEWDKVRDLVNMLKPLKDATMWVSLYKNIIYPSNLHRYYTLFHCVDLLIKFNIYFYLCIHDLGNRKNMHCTTWQGSFFNSSSN